MLEDSDRGCSQTATLVYKSVSIHRPNFLLSPSRITLFNFLLLKYSLLLLSNLPQ